MDYKSRLQKCVTDAQGALEKANTLPDASGGGTIKSCTVRLVLDVAIEDDAAENPCVYVYYSKLVDGEISHLEYVYKEPIQAGDEVVLSDVASGLPVVIEIYDGGGWRPVYAYHNNTELHHITFDSYYPIVMVYVPSDAQGDIEVTLSETLPE